MQSSVKYFQIQKWFNIFLFFFVQPFLDEFKQLDRWDEHMLSLGSRGQEKRKQEGRVRYTHKKSHDRCRGSGMVKWWDECPIRSEEAQNGALSWTGFDSLGDWRLSPLAFPPTTLDWKRKRTAQIVSRCSRYSDGITFLHKADPYTIWWSNVWAGLCQEHILEVLTWGSLGYD